MRRLLLHLKGALMKKVSTYKLLYGAAVLMVLGFCIHLAVDYCQYCSTLNSAPFSVWILVDSILWLIPAALAFTAGYIAKKRKLSKEKSQ